MRESRPIRRPTPSWVQGAAHEFTDDDWALINSWNRWLGWDESRKLSTYPLNWSDVLLIKSYRNKVASWLTEDDVETLSRACPGEEWTEDKRLRGWALVGVDGNTTAIGREVVRYALEQRQRLTPCCGKVCRLPDGREAIMWNPYNRSVCCHACGQEFVMKRASDRFSKMLDEVTRDSVEKLRRGRHAPKRRVHSVLRDVREDQKATSDALARLRVKIATAYAGLYEMSLEEATKKLFGGTKR